MWNFLCFSTKRVLNFLEIVFKNKQVKQSNLEKTESKIRITKCGADRYKYMSMKYSIKPITRYKYT